MSSAGEVRSLDRLSASGNRLRGKPLAPRTTLAGYPIADLWRDGKPQTFRVHRLVLAAFVGPCPPGMEGCHDDGDPSNNQLTNLRWDTHSANIADQVTHGTHREARKIVCHAGHPYDEANTRHRAGGKRTCRECHRDRARSYRARQGTT